ncbi:hypothetical protein [Kitasatospora sp. NPDC127116]|uniref:hypothetical protein n=1 Tax=Kitasatospora sp. NPDC127116 TaxID=3345367 RepID=UPI0036436B37
MGAADLPKSAPVRAGGAGPVVGEGACGDAGDGCVDGGGAGDEFQQARGGGGDGEQVGEDGGGVGAVDLAGAGVCGEVDQAGAGPVVEPGGAHHGAVEVRAGELAW